MTPANDPDRLPDAEQLIITAPEAWTPARIQDLHDRILAGATAVVLNPPIDPAWHDLLGVDPGPSVPAGEVVVEPTDHPAGRNLPEVVVRTPRSPQPQPTLLRPREGTEAVLATRVHLGEQAAVTVRHIGEGLAIAVALPMDMAALDAPDTVAGDAMSVVAASIRRLLRGVGSSGSSPQPAIGIGILGYGQHGGMGWYHANAAIAVEGLRLAAIAELHPGRRDDAGKRFPHVNLHESIDDMLDDADVDLVLVATPPSTHHELSRRVLRSGRHAVVEKPLCFTAAEADDLLEVAADTGRLLTVHQNRRWDADFRAIRRLIREGQLGEVFNVETFVGGFEHPCRLWHSDIGVSGGRLYDWGAHLIDQTLRLLDVDKPAEVQAVGHKRVWHDVTNLDQVRVRMRTDDGREAEFLDSDILAARRPKYVVQGTSGTLVGHYQPVVREEVTADRGYERTEHHHAEGPAQLTLAAHHAGWGMQETEVPGLPAVAHPFHRALADHLQMGDPVPVDPVQIRDLTAVLEAAHTSAHDGGRTIRPA